MAFTIGAIIAGGLAAAGGLSVGIKNLVEGNWPWEDPEAWFLDTVKGSVGGLGSVVGAIQDQPTISEMMAGTSREGGTAGELQGATGQGIAQALFRSQGKLPSQQAGTGAGGGPLTDLSSGGGVNRWDQADWNENPSRSDIRKEAWKDIGIGIGTTVASLAIPYAGEALGTALGAGTSAAGTAANAATQAATPVAQGVSASAPTLASSIANVGKQALQQGATSAALGAARGAIDDGGEGALRGGLSGFVGGAVGSLGGSAFGEAFPNTSFREPIPSVSAVRPPMAATPAPAWQPPFSWQPVSRPPTGAGATLARPLPRLGGGYAGAATSMAMTPRPPRPMEGPYPQRPEFMGPFSSDMPYGRRPWWAGA